MKFYKMHFSLIATMLVIILSIDINLCEENYNNLIKEFINRAREIFQVKLQNQIHCIIDT